MAKEFNVVPAERNQGHQSLNPGIVAAAFVVLFISSLVPVTLLVSDTHFPSPIQPPAQSWKILLCRI